MYDNVRSKKSSRDVALWLFKKLNIEYTEGEAREEDTTYGFSFQDAYFSIVCSLKDEDAFICFNYIYTDKYKYRYAIQHLCNSLNKDYHQAICFFTYDETNDTVAVHMKSTIILDDENEINKERFTNMLNGFFSFRRAFHNEIESIKQSFDKKEDIDVIDELYREKRGRYLLLEQEIAQRHFSVLRTPFHHMVLTPHDIFSLSDSPLLKERIRKISFTHIHHSILTVSIDEYDTFNIASAIRKLRETMTEEEAKSDEYLLSITCIDGSHYSASMTWQSESKISDYFLLSIHNPYLLLNKEIQTEAEKVLNMIYVLDKSQSNNEAEVKYMINDALDKAQAGNYEELTDEQKVLVNFSSWSLAEDIYWGNKYFFDKCYFQAIKHYERILSAVHPIVDSLKKKQINDIMDVYYKLGFCYGELEIYSKALYYLDVPYNFGHVNGCMEYINCLVKSKDFRAIEVIDQQLSNINNRLSDFDEDDDIPSVFLDYRGFLIRRRTFVLIEAKKYDEAEKMLKQMLESEEEGMRTYAKSELEYLKKLMQSTSYNNDKERNNL